MKKSTILFSAILAVIVGSSFTHANSSKGQNLDLNAIKKGHIVDVKDLRGHKQIVNVVIDGSIVTNQVNTTDVIVTQNYAVVGTSPGTGTGTGKNTKLAKLINDYK
ncbi:MULTISPECIES: hypothetical protein [unclassified Chryseobacterium]|uniref:hypothetical protein n=1 Tax=unclassified Chryseobacterium TaxID=2593645 RepID=UPI0028530A38|nr:hypothetical protein [Chryseobacterium sp. CFS7]MDR4892566.1 hypothetical protein [Chryseobacterium sp. CFS7]